LRRNGSLWPKIDVSADHHCPPTLVREAVHIRDIVTKFIKNVSYSLHINLRNVLYINYFFPACFSSREQLKATTVMNEMPIRDQNRCPQVPKCGANCVVDRPSTPLTTGIGTGGHGDHRYGVCITNCFFCSHLQPFAANSQDARATTRQAWMFGAGLCVA
jgi:hypothetical protein